MPLRCLFTLGPVQSFIECARTSRDLWSGSYLLSWLVAHAAGALRSGTKFHSPAIDSNPLYKGVKGAAVSSDEKALMDKKALIPCLPNTFRAVVDDTTDAEALVADVEKAVREEWKRIADSVHGFLKGKWESYGGWDEGWDAQIRDAWEIRVAVVSDSADDEKCNRTLNRLDNALKQVRGWPMSHEGESLRRPKCNLCGMRSQVNPRAAGKTLSDEEYACAYRGERLRPGDRLCAVCTVKRFAWAHYFSERCRDKLQALRVDDTPTLAARAWISSGDGILPQKFEEDLLERSGRSGSWFHWSAANQGEAGSDGTIPSDDDWEWLKGARKKMQEAGKPMMPRPYFAILAADGDEMGKAFRSKVNDLSGKLQKFATDAVPRIVEENCGTLIYSGGDDVLALLPLHTAIACATKLNKAFREVTKECTLSAGLAVVHYKQDFRDSLAAARAAEKLAKNKGRNRLVLAVHPRGGAGHMADLPWDGAIEKFSNLFNELAGGASGRWLYRLRREVDLLQGAMTGEMLDLEFHRILHHADNPPRASAEAAWVGFGASIDTIDTMMAAAFIARDGEE